MPHQQRHRSLLSLLQTCARSFAVSREKVGLGTTHFFEFWRFCCVSVDVELVLYQLMTKTRARWSFRYTHSTMIAIRSVAKHLSLARPSTIVAFSIPWDGRKTSKAFSSSSRAFKKTRTRQRRVRQSSKSLVATGPSMETAEKMTLSLKSMENASLVTLGGMGNHKACREMLRRHIMVTDKCSYQVACFKFLELEQKNHEGVFLLALPFQLGVGSAIAGLISIPLVFHLPTVEFFNEYYVTAEHPPLKDLETALEVGSWSWNWMEPPLGTCTFVLLCVQYIR